MQRRSRVIGLAAAGAMLMASSSIAAATTPVQNGCPAAAELISVAYLEANGPYELPGRIDDPANGGNGDGYVCGFPLPDPAFGPGLDFTVYQFYENNLAAKGRP